MGVICIDLLWLPIQRLRSAQDRGPTIILDFILIYLILINEKAYHDRYSEKDKKYSTQSSEWVVPYWYVDAGAAMMNCMLLIEEIGLKSGFLGSHNMISTEIKSLMKIPESYQLLGFVYSIE